MVWLENNSDQYQVPDDVVDIAFRIECKMLTLDHAHALAEQISAQLPWMKEEPQAGIHCIFVAASGNGWMRPENNETELLQLSKRTKMHIRIPKHRVKDSQRLTGKTLDINGHFLKVGAGQIKLLSDSTTLFARHVVTEERESETLFLQRQVQELKEKGISVKKMLCGRRNYFKIPGRLLYTRTLMLAELSKEESVLLQQNGLGTDRLLGCGLVLPHKGIAPVLTEN